MENNRELLDSYGTIVDDQDYGWYLANNEGKAVRDSYYTKGLVTGPEALVSSMLSDVYGVMYFTVGKITLGR